MARVIPAVARALSVLELFLGERAELTARDITDSLALPRTTVHELLHTLVELGYLAPSAVSKGSFRLGVKTLQLGSAFAERLDLATEGRATAEQIVAACDETVHVAVLDGAEVVYVAKVDSTRSVRMVSALGRRIPAHCTSVGKMLLSGLSDDDLSGLYAGTDELVALTDRSITSVEELRTALREIRSEGVAFERMESNPEVTCVAAPIYDHSGSMVAAMSISVPVVRWDARSRADWAKLVRSGAEQLSASLGAPDRPERDRAGLASPRCRG